MKVTLIKIIRQSEGSGKSTYKNLINMIKEVELIIPPQLNTIIRMNSYDFFYIERLKQDIENNKILLYSNEDHSKHDFYEGYLNSVVKINEKNGWKVEAI